jgi:hypothetical protein
LSENNHTKGRKMTGVHTVYDHGGGNHHRPVPTIPIILSSLVQSFRNASPKFLNIQPS